MSESSVSSLMQRVQKIDYPVINPGMCSLCSNSTCEDGFADTGIFIDWHGRIYFCRNCAVEIGNVFGLITPDRYEEYKRVNAEQAQLLSELQTSVTALEQAFATLSDLPRYSIGTLGDPISSDPQDYEVFVPAVSVEPGEADELIAAGESLLTELSDGQGSGSSEGSQSGADTTEHGVSEGPDDTDESTGSDTTGLGIGI
jgi:hypothetical protein